MPSNDHLALISVSLPLPTVRLTQSFLLCVSGCRPPCCQQLCLILLLQALQIHTQAVGVQSGVPGSLQEAGGQVVHSSLPLCFWITMMFGLEQQNHTISAIYPALR